MLPNLPDVRIYLTLPYLALYALARHITVKLGKFGHQVKSETYLQTVLILMRRLLMSRLIRIFTVCLANLFLFQYLKYETNKVAVRI